MRGKTRGVRPTVRGGLLAIAVLLLARASPAATWRDRVDALALPLTVVDATVPRAFLVLFTGDGGWQAVDRALADGLAPHGITTLGWSTVRYFVTTREPARVMRDVRRVLEALGAERMPVYLGGYSFGAEVAPVVLAGQGTADDRRRVAGLLLLGPSAAASFRVDPLDWVRTPTPDPRYLVAPAVRRLAGLRVVCIAGVDDPTAICDDLGGVPGVAVRRVPGTHHFENGMPQVVDAAVRLLFEHRGETP